MRQDYELHGENFAARRAERREKEAARKIALDLLP